MTISNRPPSGTGAGAVAGDRLVADLALCCSAGYPCTETRCMADGGTDDRTWPQHDRRRAAAEPVRPRRGRGGGRAAGLLPAATRAQSATPGDDGPNWPGTLPGRHRQVVDAYNVSSGHPLVFAHTFLATKPAGRGGHGHRSARRGADRAEQRDVGKIQDRRSTQHHRSGNQGTGGEKSLPAPKARCPAGRRSPRFDRLLARGAVIGACNVALHGQSKMLAGNAGVSAEQAAKEWIENVVPGVTVVPSGVWGLNRAQEAGCTYCAGG